MRYLSLALYAEGPTDEQFLPPILLKLTAELCLLGCPESVDLAETVWVIDAPAGGDQLCREERIRAAARAAWGAFDILFIHSDGGNDPTAALSLNVEPARQLLLQEPEAGAIRTVPVIPVRETEAWALADGDALRQTLGSGKLSDQQLSLPRRAALAEGVTDPKALLEAAYTTVTKGKARVPVTHYFPTLGRLIRLERLRLLPAFQRLQADLTEALRQLGILLPVAGSSPEHGLRRHPE